MKLETKYSLYIEGKDITIQQGNTIKITTDKNER